jgi:hypothetical protein
LSMKTNVMLVMAMVAAITVSAAALSPKLISHQGRLTDSADAPLTGTYSLTFAIYNLPVGGVALWSETHSSVPVSDGLFAVLLGSVAEIPDSLFADTSRFLGIKVASDPEISPRTRVTSSPYSLRVNTVDDAKGGDLTGDLNVSGNIATSTFQMEAGAALGRVLTSSDALGNAVWAPPTTGGGNTLDEAYDNGGGGNGRKIYADTGAVDITGFSSNDALVVHDTAAVGTNPKSLLRAAHRGTGDAKAVTHVDSGRGVRVEHEGDGAGVSIEHGGKGGGIAVNLSDATNVKPGIQSKTIGASYAFLGEVGVDLGGVNFVIDSLGRAVIGAFAGASSPPDIKGIAGISESSDGVWGVTGRNGTYATSTSPVGIKAGVKGLGSPFVTGTADHFAIAGISVESYSGSGGICVGSGERGHGLIGMPGPGLTKPNHTQAGIWGLTREKAWADFKTTFPLTDVSASQKSQVAILGQAIDQVAVWGESRTDFGTVGTTGGPLGRAALPEVRAGVYGKGEKSDSLDEVYGGYFESDSAYGALGRTQSIDHKKAGIIAWGAGDDDAGAALKIRDGAILIQGPAKAADKGSFPVADWAPVTTCPGGCPDCIHTHVMGWAGTTTIANPLVDELRSIIQLTPQHPSFPMTASVTGIAEGSFTVKVFIPDCPAVQAAGGPPPAVMLHYLVINME